MPPAPPSVTTRPKQPVMELARGLASRLQLQTCEDVAVKVKATPPMKNVPIGERQELLNDAIQKGSADLRGKRVLLFDDLIESGSTLRRVAEVLKESGASAVYALVLTRTK